MIIKEFEDTDLAITKVRPPSNSIFLAAVFPLYLLYSCLWQQNISSFGILLPRVLAASAAGSSTTASSLLTPLLSLQFLESSKTLRDAWKNILLTEANLADSWWTLYQTIPRTSESRQPPEETPQDVLDRVKELGTVYKGLQEDMMEEVRKMDTLLIQPLQECAVSLTPERGNWAGGTELTRRDAAASFETD